MSLVIASRNNLSFYLSGAGLYRRPGLLFTYGNSSSSKTRSPTRTLALVYRLWSYGTFPNISKSSLHVLAHQSNPAHHLWPVFKLTPLGGSHFPPLGIPGYLSPNSSPKDDLNFEDCTILSLNFFKGEAPSSLFRLSS